MFEIISKISKIEIIAKGNSIRELGRINKFYGNGNWRKMKGYANIRFCSGDIVNAELHWYEAHGKGQKEFKIKRIIQ
jgi:hypothetical protein